MSPERPLAEYQRRQKSAPPPTTAELHVLERGPHGIAIIGAGGFAMVLPATVHGCAQTPETGQNEQCFG